MSPPIHHHASSCGQVRSVDDSSWLVSSGMVVLSMQAGFALLEAGVVRRSHAANIMMKNLLDLCISAVSWWAVGWGIAFGASGEWGVIGTDQFWGVGVSDVAHFFFQFTFAATVSTIDSGSVAERMRFFPCVGYSPRSSSPCDLLVVLSRTSTCSLARSLAHALLYLLQHTRPPPGTSRCRCS